MMDIGAKITENLARVRERIDAAVEKSGRTKSDVKMVAVTKYVDAEITSQLIDAGQYVLGESRPQQLWNKAEMLDEHSIEWHLIGHLQRNKVNRTLPYCSLIHSVDSIRLLKTINESAVSSGNVARCLLEVNISGETAKHGFRPGEIESALEVVSQLPGIKLNGFMGMGGLHTDERKNRTQFSQLRTTMINHNKFAGPNIDLKELSMGMSGDFELAIAEGATIVRIGSVLFEGIQL